MSRFKVNDMIDDIVNDYRKQVQSAVKKAADKAPQKIEQMIKSEMIYNYYDAYEPRVYKRTSQLPKSVGPFVELKTTDNVVSLNLGVEDEDPYGPYAMHHKKRGKHPIPVNEEYVFENFLEGVHPNAGGMFQQEDGSWKGVNLKLGTAPEDAINEALDDYLDELERAIDNELSKIK